MNHITLMYNYLKHKWDNGDKGEIQFSVFIGWIASAILGITLVSVWDILGLIFFIIWMMVGLIAFFVASWYVFSRLWNQITADYNHYIAEFGKHKNEDKHTSEQMATLGELFEEEESDGLPGWAAIMKVQVEQRMRMQQAELDQRRIDRERGTPHTRI